MPTFTAEVLILKTEDGNFEIFLNEEDQITLEDPAGDYVIKISREDWVAIKKFVDKEFKG